MAVVGFGKQPGAAEIHAGTPSGCATTGWPASTRCAHGRLLGGVASVESAVGDVVAVAALRPTTSAAPPSGS